MINMKRPHIENGMRPFVLYVFAFCGGWLLVCMCLQKNIRLTAFHDDFLVFSYEIVLSPSVYCNGKFLLDSISILVVCFDIYDIYPGFKNVPLTVFSIPDEASFC